MRLGAEGSGHHGAGSSDGGFACSATAATVPAAPFPIAAFAAISEDPVIEVLAAKFQTALDDAAREAGCQPR